MDSLTDKKRKQGTIEMRRGVYVQLAAVSLMHTHTKPLRYSNYGSEERSTACVCFFTAGTATACKISQYINKISKNVGYSKLYYTKR